MTMDFLRAFYDELTESGQLILEDWRSTGTS